VTADDVKHRVELPRFVYAPVKKNDVIGGIIFEHKGEVIGYSAIVSLQDAAAYESKSIIRKILDMFGGK
jgi:hypothetical protein